MQYQIADVSKPLNSVSKICDRGNVVTFHSRGGVIHNLTSGKRTQFGRQGNIYTLQTWVPTHGERASGFPRLPQ